MAAALTHIATILLLVLATIIPAAAQRPAPVGICLVAIEPNSPDEEVGGIAYRASARTCCSYILRTPDGMKIEVPDNRFRGLVRLPTLQSLHEHTPERELGRLEDLAKRYPLAASSFSSQLAELRRLVGNRQAAAARPAPPTTPGIRIAGRTYHDFQFRSLSEGRVVFRHRDGVASLPVNSLTDAERKFIHKLAAGGSTDGRTPEPPSGSPSADEGERD